MYNKLAKIWLILLVLCMSGCRLGYYSQAIAGQTRIIFGKRDNESVIADPETTPEVKNKLTLVKKLKTFAVNEIGLADNDNYNYYYQLQQDAISYSVVACPPDSLEPLTWDFPIVGALPYIGFFNLEEAKQFAKSLKAKGYDVALWPAGAYSTLGWFSDPILSSMIEYNDVQFADIILHEQTHATIYVDSDTVFNENLAVFVAYQGSLKFWQQQNRPDLVELAQARRHDQLIAAAEVAKLSQALHEIYNMPITREQKIQLKIKLVIQFRRRFRFKIRPLLKTDDFNYYSSIDVNNATIATAALYGEKLVDFDTLYRHCDKDLKRTFAELKVIADLPQPSERLSLIAQQISKPKSQSGE